MSVSPHSRKSALIQSDFGRMTVSECEIFGPFSDTPPIFRYLALLEGQRGSTRESQNMESPS